jgi:hypothetical protein
MSRTLTLQEASDAVTEPDWRYLLGTLRTSVPVRTLTQAAQLASTAITASAPSHVALGPTGHRSARAGRISQLVHSGR